MKILIYGGSFNPPHMGHEAALHSASEAVGPDLIYVIPAGIPPHKQLAEGSPTSEERLRLSQLAFSDEQGVRVSDIELKRLGKSYTIDTLQEIADLYEDAELYFLVGTDMLMSIEQWYSFDQILSTCTLVALPRYDGDFPAMEEKSAALRGDYGARVVLIRKSPLPVASTDLRASLRFRQGRELLSEPVYAEIIRKRYYGARPDLAWLREKAYAMLKPTRVAHVQQCEIEAVKMAERWGEDPGEIAEAAILHDITKKLSPSEQLRLCEKYGIILDIYEQSEPKLLHARTGAYLARDLFGVSDSVFHAIERHTTGQVGMSTMDKIIYLADMAEAGRSFPGVDRIRGLLYTDLNLAMEEALRLSEEEVRSRGAKPHPRTLRTREWLQKLRAGAGSEQP